MFVRQDIPISPAGPAIEVEVKCGFAQHIDFDCDLFDTQGNNPQTVHSGSNIQSAPPPFTLNVAPSQLGNRFLLTTATVQSLGGNSFSVDVVFRQAGAQIGQLSAQGTFQDQITISLVGRFV